MVITHSCENIFSDLFQFTDKIDNVIFYRAMRTIKAMYDVYVQLVKFSHSENK